MTHQLDISPTARPADRYAIVVSRYNGQVTDRLREGAVATLLQHGVADERILVVPVPGSFEIPIVADRLARSGHYDGIVCLGAVVQGETAHHEYINHQVTQGIRVASQQTGVPVAFGLLTCQTLELALDRAGGKRGNKGHEAALAALETLATLRAIDENMPSDAVEATNGSDAAPEEDGDRTDESAEEDEDEDDTGVGHDQPDPRRRKAREAALQALYQVDLNPEMPLAAIGDFLDGEITDPALRAFAGQLVKGVTTRRVALDRLIEEHSDNWSLSRMAGTDRNILRLAAWELFHSDVPFRVILDEAVELAKIFGDARSPDFVNGVLDAVVPAERRAVAGSINT